MDHNQAPDDGSQLKRLIVWIVAATVVLGGLTWLIMRLATAVAPVLQAITPPPGPPASGVPSPAAARPQLPEASGSQTQPPPGVLVGPPWAWRTLCTAELTHGTLATGRFLPGGDEQALLIATDADQGPSTIYQADGRTATAGIRFGFFVPDATNWDYDGDGIDDLVPADSVKQIYEDLQLAIPSSVKANRPEEQTPVFALDGTLLAVLDGGGVWQGCVTGDFDGDGHADLACNDHGYSFYGQGGRRLGKFTVVLAFPQDVAGDFDGDGKFELAGMSSQSNSLVGCSIGNRQQDLGPTALGVQDYGLAAADLDGDKTSELISPQRGYDDLKRHQAVAFHYPPTAYLPANWSGTALACDLDHDGRREVAIVSTHNGEGAELYIFAPDGKCTHYEAFDKSALGHKCLRAQGRDHLVLQFVDRVIIYP